MYIGKLFGLFLIGAAIFLFYMLYINPLRNSKPASQMEAESSPAGLVAAVAVLIILALILVCGIFLLILEV